MTVLAAQSLVITIFEQVFAEVACMSLGIIVSCCVITRIAIGILRPKTCNTVRVAGNALLLYIISIFFCCTDLTVLGRKFKRRSIITDKALIDSRAVALFASSIWTGKAVLQCIIPIFVIKTFYTFICGRLLIRPGNIADFTINFIWPYALLTMWWAITTSNICIVAILKLSTVVTCLAIIICKSSITRSALILTDSRACQAILMAAVELVAKVVSTIAGLALIDQRTCAKHTRWVAAIIFWA